MKINPRKKPFITYNSAHQQIGNRPTTLANAHGTVIPIRQASGSPISLPSLNDAAPYKLEIFFPKLFGADVLGASWSDFSKGIQQSLKFHSPTPDRFTRHFQEDLSEKQILAKEFVTSCLNQIFHEQDAVVVFCPFDDWDNIGSSILSLYQALISKIAQNSDHKIYLLTPNLQDIKPFYQQAFLEAQTQAKSYNNFHILQQNALANPQTQAELKALERASLIVCDLPFETSNSTFEDFINQVPTCFLSSLHPDHHQNDPGTKQRIQTILQHNEAVIATQAAHPLRDSLTNLYDQALGDRKSRDTIEHLSNPSSDLIPIQIKFNDPQDYPACFFACTKLFQLMPTKSNFSNWSSESLKANGIDPLHLQESARKAIATDSALVSREKTKAELLAPCLGTINSLTDLKSFLERNPDLSSLDPLSKASVYLLAASESGFFRMVFPELLMQTPLRDIASLLVKECNQTLTPNDALAAHYLLRQLSDYPPLDLTLPDVHQLADTASPTKIDSSITQMLEKAIWHLYNAWPCNNFETPIIGSNGMGLTSAPLCPISTLNADLWVIEHELDNSVIDIFYLHSNSKLGLAIHRAAQELGDPNLVKSYLGIILNRFNLSKNTYSPNRPPRGSVVILADPDNTFQETLSIRSDGLPASSIIDFLSSSEPPSIQYSVGAHDFIGAGTITRIIRDPLLESQISDLITVMKFLPSKLKEFIYHAFDTKVRQANQEGLTSTDDAREIYQFAEINSNSHEHQKLEQFIKIVTTILESGQVNLTMTQKQIVQYLRLQSISTQIAIRNFIELVSKTDKTIEGLMLMLKLS